MPKKHLYYYKKTRKQRSKLFIRMGVVSLGYIASLYLVEYFSAIVVPESIHDIILVSFSLLSIILFSIALWHRKNPATYEASITDNELSINYPETPAWSFKVKIQDIEKIEHRKNHSSGGESRLRVGLVMKNSDFHEIVMNYGNSINKMFKVLKTINPNITFSKSVKTSYFNL